MGFSSIMTFSEHLEELRRRIIKCLIALGGSSVLGFAFLTPILYVLLILTGPFQAIMAYLTIGITAGVLLSLPIILYQIWMFVFPALNQKEQRYALPLFMTIIFFFLLGAVFAYLIVVPIVLQFDAGLFQVSPV